MHVDFGRVKFIIVSAMLLPALGLAHGVAYSVFHAGTGIEATYDDGKPMAYCDAAVFSPVDLEHEYQTGTTDPGGRFAFVPDTNGLWRVTVDDGMGHTVTAEVSIGQAEMTGARTQGPRAMWPRPLALLVGLSIIFGLFGIYSLAKCGKRQTATKSGCGGGECECTSPKA